MLFTEYISMNIKHVFIGVYNTQFHPSKSRGHTTLGQGTWGAGPKGLQRDTPWTIKALEGERRGLRGLTMALSTWPFPFWEQKTTDEIWLFCEKGIKTNKTNPTRGNFD